MRTMKHIALVVCCIVYLACGQAEAASKSMCPVKVLSAGSIEGIFLGVDCVDMCYGAVKLPNGEEFGFLMGEDEAIKVFGEGTGQKVSVAYEVHQFWNEYGNTCSRQEVLVSGKLLAAATTQKASTGAMSPPQKGSSQAYKGFSLGGITLSLTPEQVVEIGTKNNEISKVRTVAKTYDRGSSIFFSLHGVPDHPLRTYQHILPELLSIPLNDIASSNDIDHFDFISKENKNFVLDEVESIYRPQWNKPNEKEVTTFFITMPGFKQKAFIILALGKIVKEVPSVFNERYGKAKKSDVEAGRIGNDIRRLEVLWWENDKEVAVFCVDRLIIIDKEVYKMYAQFFVSELNRVRNETKAKKEIEEQRKKEAIRSKI